MPSSRSPDRRRDRSRSRSRSRDSRDKGSEDRRSKRRGSGDNGRSRSRSRGERGREKRDGGKKEGASTSAERRRKRTGWDETPNVSGSGFAENPLAAQILSGQADAQQALALSMQVAQSKATMSRLSRIYVGNLDYQLTEHDMKQIFAAFGQITAVDMPKENGRSKGFCFIEFATPQVAEQALQAMNGFQIKGRTIRLGRPSPQTGGPGGGFSSDQFPNLATALAQQQAMVGGDPTQAGALAAASLLGVQGGALGAETGFLGSVANLPQVAVPALGIGSLGTTDPNIAAQLTAAAAAAGAGSGVNMATTPQAMRRIYVGFVPYQFGPEDLRKIFQVFGEIVSCELIPSAEKREQHRGYGFVEFTTHEAADMAIRTMNGFEVAGKVLRCNWATSQTRAAIGGVDPVLSNLAAAAAAQLLPGHLAAPVSGALGSPLPGLSAVPSHISSAPPASNRFNNGPSNAAECTVCLSEMISYNDLDEDVPAEIRSECQKFGNVEDVKLDIEPSLTGGDKIVKVYVRFREASEADKAAQNLSGRWFGGKKIKCDKSTKSLDTIPHHPLPSAAATQ